MGDLGDLSVFLKDANVANLDWADVDEEDYRKRDILPKQNLDIAPDLEALWAREDESAANYLVPNKGPLESFQGAGEVHTMGDLSQEHGHLRARAEDIRKVARLSIMQSNDTHRLRDALTKRFDKDTLRANRQVIAEVLQERGLLGRYYISASDFSGCDKGSKSPIDFARRFAGDAKFVVAKKACSNCIHAKSTVTGGSNCAVFHKEIQLQVPYTNELAQAVENTQAARGKVIQASAGAPKERIRLAMLAPSPSSNTGVYAGVGLSQTAAPTRMTSDSEQQLIQADNLLRKARSTQEVGTQARPIVAFLKREMVKGLPPEELVKSMRLAYSQDELKNSRAHWEPVFKEAGLYGALYSTQDSFDDCRTGADFLAKHNPGIRAIVAGSKCGSCIYSKGRCLMYGKKLLKDASELYTTDTVEAVLLEYKTAGRLQPWDTKTASTWGSDPREALKAIYRAASHSNPLHAVAPTRMQVMKGFYGSTHAHGTNEVTRREVVKQASRYMNEGLYGQELLSVLRSRFDPRDITAAKDELRTVLAEQGLQGIYYVDPAVYADYGRGCDEASRLHRSRLVPYAKMGSKCTGCVLQTKLGFCSKLNKPLVAEPPYLDKTAQQRAVLASGVATETSFEGLVNNGMSMLAEYQLQHSGMDVEVREASTPSPLDFEFNNKKLRL